MPDYGNQFLPDGRQFRWSSHDLELIQTCPRKYWYRKLLGYTGGGGNVHLVFGSHYANALERYFIYEAEGDPAPLRRVVREALTESHGWESDDPKKNRWNLIRSIVWYFDHFADADLQIATFDGKPAVEHKFSLDLGNDKDFLVGTLDRLVVKDGEYFVMDQKTTGSTLGPYYFAQFSPHCQMSAYTWAGQAVYSTPVKGVIVDAAQIVIGFTDFARSFTYRTLAQLEEWHSDALFWVGFADRCHEQDHWPMNTSSCGMYRGCEFRKVCAMSPEYRMHYMDANYERDDNGDTTGGIPDAQRT